MEREIRYGRNYKFGKEFFSIGDKEVDTTKNLHMLILELDN